MARNQVGKLAASFLGPGWGFGLGFSVVGDPVAAKVPLSAGSWRLGGVYGHTWWVDPAQRLSVVIITNTGVEGMSGAFSSDIASAVYVGRSRDAVTPRPGAATTSLANPTGPRRRHWSATSPAPRAASLRRVWMRDAMRWSRGGATAHGEPPARRPCRGRSRPQFAPARRIRAGDATGRGRARHHQPVRDRSTASVTFP